VHQLAPAAKLHHDVGVRLVLEAIDQPHDVQAPPQARQHRRLATDVVQVLALARGRDAGQVEALGDALDGHLLARGVGRRQAHAAKAALAEVGRAARKRVGRFEAALEAAIEGRGPRRRVGHVPYVDARHGLVVMTLTL